MVQVPDAPTVPPGKADEDVQAASRSTADFVQNVAPVQAQKRKSRRSRLVLILVAGIVVLGVGGYFLSGVFKKSSEKQPASQTSRSDDTEEAKLEDGFKQYSSTSLKLSFKYPEAWQVSDDEPNTVKLESTTIKLPDATGQEVDATIVMTVASTSADIDFPEDKATGVRQSEKFAYDSPATDQRQETFLSFMNLEGASDGLQAAYITGDASFTKGDPIRKADFEKVQPVIWLEFHDTQGQKLTISADAWGKNPGLESAFAVLKSFSIK